MLLEKKSKSIVYPRQKTETLETQALYLISDLHDIILDIQRERACSMYTIAIIWNNEYSISDNEPYHVYEATNETIEAILYQISSTIRRECRNLLTEISATIRYK